MAYTLINYSCFAASFAKSPGTPPPLPHQLSHPSPPHTHIGWRPAFKLYNQWVALVGAVICLAIMFIIRWYYALITLAIVAALYKLLDFLKPGRGLSLRVWSHHTPPCMCVVPSYPPMHVCGPIIPPHACVWSHHTPPMHVCCPIIPPPCMCVVPSYPPMHVCGPIIPPPCMCVVPSYPPHACVWSHHTPPMHVCGPIIPPHACVWSHHTPPMHVCGPIIPPPCMCVVPSYPPHACVWSHHTPPCMCVVPSYPPPCRRQLGILHSSVPLQLLSQEPPQTGEAGHPRQELQVTLTHYLKGLFLSFQKIITLGQ